MFKISKLHILQGEFPDREESCDDWMARVRTIEFEQPITLKEVLDGYEQWARIATISDFESESEPEPGYSLRAYTEKR